MREKIMFYVLYLCALAVLLLTIAMADMKSELNRMNKLYNGMADQVRSVELNVAESKNAINRQMEDLESDFRFFFFGRNNE